MTVNTTATKQSFPGNGVSTTFPFTFAMGSTSTIQVFVTTSAGVQTQITQGPASTQYQVVFNPAVSPNPTPVGGTVTYSAGGTFLPIGSTLTIIRETPDTQGFSFANQGTAYPQAIEQADDNQQCQLQELLTETTQAIQFNLADGPHTTLPPAAQIANQVMGFDSNGNPIAVATITPGTTVSTAMIPVVTASTTLTGESLLSGTQFFGTFALAQAATVPTAVQYLRIGGFTTSGDLGAALYKKVVGGSIQLTTADGATWRIAENFLTPQMFGAKGDGATDDSTAINAAISLATTLTGSTVLFSGNTFAITAASVLMKPNVTVQGCPGSAIRQTNGANLKYLVDFTTNVANRSIMRGMVIDGNRANNTDDTAGTGKAAVQIGVASSVLFENNTVQNCPGAGIQFSTGPNPIIRGNFVTNTEGVGIQGVSPGTTSGALITGNTVQGVLGIGGIQSQGTNYVTVTGNFVQGTFSGGTGAVTHISMTSGGTVTWVSGPDFTTIFPGMFLVTNSGNEYFITAKASNTSLTVTGALTTLTNVPGALGTGDLVNFGNCAYITITGNVVTSGVAGGIVIHNEAITTQSCLMNTVTGNVTFFTGEPGLSVQTIVNGTTVQGVNMTGNVVFRPAAAGAALGSSIQCGLTVTTAASTVNILAVGNTFYDDLSDMQFAAIIGGTAQAQVGMFGNFVHGAVNTGVTGSPTVLSGAVTNL